MEITLTDALLIALVTGIASGGVAWGGVKMQLAWMQRELDRAHRRLNLIGAPDADPQR